MRVLDDKKICFIICANNKQYLDECLLYLNLLEVPAGYSTELLIVEDAHSMTSGYNEAMNSSDAKYKIYLHQDSFVINRNMLVELLSLFNANNEIGLVGTIGSERLPSDAVMWHTNRCGNFYRLDEINELIEKKIDMVEDRYREVQAVDGLFMATQYDIPWREDILDGWDFYDVSQCMEFRRKGFKVVVAPQEKAWVLHACGVPSYRNYDKYRRIILKEYKDLIASTRRVLFLMSKEIGVLGIPYSLRQMGYEVDLTDRTFSISKYSEKQVEKLEELIETGNYDLIVSYDFLSVAAVACTNMKVHYWAWVYDVPMPELYTEKAISKFVYVSVFDKRQYNMLQQFGIKNVYYLPLATEVEYFEKVAVTEEDRIKFKADVSFVGRLYDKRGFDNLFEEHAEYLRTEAESIAKSCDCTWDGVTGVYNKASDELIDYMLNRDEYLPWRGYRIDPRYCCESVRLAQRCNEIERIRILNHLAEQYKVVLYSDDGGKEKLKNVEVRPWVGYWTDMPKVFNLSKINLNITSRSIESGIPQRVFDIMAVGGFCLTNYQPELEDYFEIGKDLEVYHNLDELCAKVGYYLQHEEARTRIAINGYNKVKKKHSYIKRFEYIMDKIILPSEKRSKDE